MQAQLPEPVVPSFLMLSQAADISHTESHSHADLARLAKTNVELDRNQAMQEAGYRTWLTHLVRPELHLFKSDLLIGLPQERIGAYFDWPEQSRSSAHVI